METFGERLQKAVEDHGPRPPSRPGSKGSVNQFCEQLKKLPKGAGASYATVWRIIAGKAEPTPAFIDAALELMPQVRREWLVEGEGAMTVAGAVAERMAAPTAADVPVPEMGPASDVMRIAFALAWKVFAAPYTAEQLAEPMQARSSDGQPAARVPRSEMLYARAVEALFAPLKAAGLPARQGAALDDFLAAVALALHAYARAHPLQREEEENA